MPAFIAIIPSAFLAVFPIISLELSRRQTITYSHDGLISPQIENMSDFNAQTSECQARKNLMGNNFFFARGPREATRGFRVSTFSVVEVGNAQRKTDRHDGYTGVWVCVEATVLFARFRLLLLRSGRQKWYVMFLSCIGL